MFHKTQLVQKCDKNRDILKKYITIQNVEHKIFFATF